MKRLIADAVGLTINGIDDTPAHEGCQRNARVREHNDKFVAANPTKFVNRGKEA